MAARPALAGVAGNGGVFRLEGGRCCGLTETLAAEGLEAGIRVKRGLPSIIDTPD